MGKLDGDLCAMYRIGVNQYSYQMVIDVIDGDYGDYGGSIII